MAPVGSRVTRVTVNGQPLDPGRAYTVATPDFVFKGGDGYTVTARVKGFSGKWSVGADADPTVGGRVRRRHSRRGAHDLRNAHRAGRAFDVGRVRDRG